MDAVARLETALRPAIGRRLLNVAYWLFDWELERHAALTAASEDIKEYWVHIGIELYFETMLGVFLTWGSIEVPKEMAEYGLIEDHMWYTWSRADEMRWHAPPNSQPWTTCVGRPLKQVDILGLAPVPHAVRLSFEDSSVSLPSFFLIGTGYEDRDHKTIDEGDQIAILSQEACATYVLPQLLRSFP